MAIDIKKYKLVKEHDDHYEMQHPEGSKFRVAKAGLPEEFHKKMQHFYDGGESQPEPEYSEDKAKADVQSAFNPQPAQPPKDLVRLKTGNYVNTRTREVVTKDKVGYADGGEVDSEQPQEPGLLDKLKSFIPPYAPSNQEEQPVQQEPVEAPEQPQAIPPEQQQALMNQQQPQQQTVNAPLQDVIGEYQKAFEAEKGAQTEKARIEETKQKGIAEQFASQAQSLDDLRKAGQDRQQQLHDESIKLHTAIANGEIDPDRLWNNSSTAGKIGASIGLILGGIGGGMTGRGNEAAAFLNNMIQRDVDAQKENLANKRSLYSLNLQQSNNEREADLMTQRQLLDATQAKVNAASAQAAGPEAKQNAIMLNAGIDKQKAALDQQLALFKMQTQVATQPFHKEALGILTPDQQKRAVILPDGKTAALATSEEAAKEARQAVTQFTPIDQNLQRLASIGRAPVPGTKSYEEAKSIISTTKLQLKEMQKLGRLSPEGMKVLNEQLSDPTTLLGAAQGPHKTQVLRETLAKERDAVLSNALPGYGNPSNIPGARKKYQ